MKQVLYRSYVDFGEIYDDFGSFSLGNDIYFTFFMPCSNNFDCIVVNIPDNIKILPPRKQPPKDSLEMDNVLVDGKRCRINVNPGIRKWYYEADLCCVDDINEDDYIPTINTQHGVIALEIVEVQYTTIKENADKFNCKYIENADSLINDMKKRISV